jgi:membrane protease YdiL (CAAX protease family)
LLTFTFVAVAISFAQAWLRLKTDSLWPPIFLHASHNLWM